MGKKCVQAANRQFTTLWTTARSAQADYNKDKPVCTNWQINTIHPLFVHSPFSLFPLLKTPLSARFPQSLLLLLLICIQKHPNQSFLKKEFV